MNDNREQGAFERLEDVGPLPNRITRGTVVGCLGILCVLALPALVFLPIEDFRLPAWLLRLTLLAGLALVACGIWLLGRVPSGFVARPADPLHPLTSEGRSPVIERPAETSNRLSLGVVALLTVVAACGCLVASFAPFGRRDVVVGTAMTSVVGFCAVAMSALVLTRRTPTPAWSWVRAPIAGGGGAGIFALACGGIVVVVWSLFVAGFAGFMWARIGLGMLVLFGVLLGPLIQRGALGGYPRPSSPQPPSLRRQNTSGSRDSSTGQE